MSDLLIELFSMCEWRSEFAFANERYQELIDLLKKVSIDEDLKKKALIELYRYSFYSGVSMSPDPRGGHTFKIGPIFRLKEELEQQKLSPESISELRKINNDMQKQIDDPEDTAEANLRGHTVEF